MVFPPKKINPLYGYRTNRSMKSEINWLAANKVASIVLVIGCAILVVQKLIFLVFFPLNAKLNAILFLATLLIIIVTILIVTENHLKKISNDK